MELQKGRPADTAGRLEKEIRTYDLLDRLGVAYERVDHAPAMTMEVCQEIDQTLQAVICKNLFLCNRQETAFYLLMIPETVVLLSHKKPDGHINVKVEFGEGEGKVPLDNIAKRAETYKPKERVTYKMIKEYIEAKYGFKVHTAYIAEVKRDLGLPMYDAPNAVEELKQPRKHPTAEKVEAIKDALKYFGVCS